MGNLGEKTAETGIVVVVETEARESNLRPAFFLFPLPTCGKGERRDGELISAARPGGGGGLVAGLASLAPPPLPPYPYCRPLISNGYPPAAG